MDISYDLIYGGWRGWGLLSANEHLRGRAVFLWRAGDRENASEHSDSAKTRMEREQGSGVPRWPVMSLTEVADRIQLLAADLESWAHCFTAGPGEAMTKAGTGLHWVQIQIPSAVREASTHHHPFVICHFIPYIRPSARGHPDTASS